MPNNSNTEEFLLREMDQQRSDFKEIKSDLKDFKAETNTKIDEIIKSINSSREVMLGLQIKAGMIGVAITAILGGIIALFVNIIKEWINKS